jgi:hypothetical protein
MAISPRSGLILVAIHSRSPDPADAVARHLRMIDSQFESGRGVIWIWPKWRIVWTIEMLLGGTSTLPERFSNVATRCVTWSAPLSC